MLYALSVLVVVVWVAYVVLDAGRHQYDSTLLRRSPDRD